MSVSNEQPVVSEGLDTTQDIENKLVTPPTELKNIKGFIEFVDTLPSYTPKNFYDSVKIYNNELFIYNQSSGSWVQINNALEVTSFINSITISADGFIRLGKTSFADTALGFYISADGIYLSSAADANKFKFKISDGTIDFNGTHSGGTVGTIPIATIEYSNTSTADAVPSGLTCSATGTTTATDGTVSAYVTLTWTAISTNTFDHYHIRFKKASYTYYQYIDAKTNTITIDGLTPNISYNFGLASVNKYGSVSAFSSDISQTTATSTTAPATVTAGSATAGIQYIILEWTHNTESDLASYNIYRNTVNNSATATLIGNCRTNYFVDGNRTGGTEYFYFIKAVNTSGLISTSFSTVKSATPRNVNSADTNISNQGWTQTCVFSSTDADTVTWGTGTFTTASGTSYSILTGNTGNMVARTFIYLDIAVSTTAYQTTTTATTAVGDGKVLIGVAQNGTGEATFQIFGGSGGVYLNGADLVTGSVTTNEIAANTIVAGNIAAGTITTTQIASDTITSGNINGTLGIAASKILIDGAVYLSNWRKAGDLTMIDGGSISANSVTTTQLNFTPVQSTDVIAKINASAEGITIDADNITISGATTFASGYDPNVALTTAQSKRRVFTAEPTTPYEVGDLWTTLTILKTCTTQRLTGSYNAADWVLATGYTDDTVANSKIKTFSQDAIPTSISAGDFWIATAAGNQLYRATAAGDTTIAADHWVAVPDQNKLGGTGSSAIGGSYSSTSSGARVRIFPDANTGIQVIDDGAADVFKAMVGGADVGDVIIGNYAAGQGVKYDKSLNTTDFKGAISAGTINIGNNFSVDNSGNMVAVSGKYVEPFTAGENITSGDIVCIKPTSLVLQCNNDSWVNERQPTTNYGSDTTMYVGELLDTLNYEYRPFIKFDFSTIPSADNILTGYFNVVSTSNAFNLSLYAIPLDNGTTTPWVEGTLTWNNKPALGASPIASYTGGGTNISFDITTWLRSLKAREIADYGFVIRKATFAGATDSRQIYTKEYNAGQYAPNITVVRLDASDGKVYKASNSTYVLSRTIIGVTQETKNATETAKVQTQGKITNVTVSQTGGKIYLSDTAGGILESPTNVTRQIKLGETLPSGTFYWDKKDDHKLIEIQTSVNASPAGYYYIPNDCRFVVVDVTIGNYRKLLTAYRDSTDHAGVGIDDTIIIDNSNVFGVKWGSNYITVTGTTVNQIFIYA